MSSPVFTNLLTENYEIFCQIQEQVLVLEQSLYFSLIRKICVWDYSEVIEERFCTLTRIWSTIKILEKIILIRGQNGFGVKGQVLLGINDLNACLNIWLVFITDWQVTANLENSWTSWKLELLGFGTLVNDCFIPADLLLKNYWISHQLWDRNLTIEFPLCQK